MLKRKKDGTPEGAFSTDLDPSCNSTEDQEYASEDKSIRGYSENKPHVIFCRFASVLSVGVVDRCAVKVIV